MPITLEAAEEAARQAGARRDRRDPYGGGDDDGDGVDHTADGPSRQVLSARGTDSLREEAVSEDGTAREWRAATNYFEDYMMRQASAATTWEQEKGVRPCSHRFSVRYATEKTGKVYGGLRHVADNAPPSLPFTTALITRTGWPYDADGNPAPPADFLSGLSRGRQATLRALRGALGGDETIRSWGRVTVVEPHTERRAGYPHAHDGIAVVGDVARSDLRPAVEAYVEANPFARETDHGPEALTLRRADDRVDAVETAESLAAEMTNNLVGYAFDHGDDDPLRGVDDAERRFAALLWATGKQSVSFDDTFRTWIERSQAEWDPDEKADGEVVLPEIDPDAVDPPEYVTPKPSTVAYSFPDE